MYRILYHVLRDAALADELSKSVIFHKMAFLVVSGAISIIKLYFFIIIYRERLQSKRSRKGHEILRKLSEFLDKEIKKYDDKTIKISIGNYMK